MSAPSPATHSVAKRRVRTPRLLKIGRTVLIVGSVLAVAAAIGPIWAVRAGVAMAVIAGVGALVLVTQQLRAERRRHTAGQLRQIRDHGAALSVERRRNAEVVDVLTARAHETGGELNRLRGQNRRLGGKLAELSGSNASLRSELAGRDVTIVGLRETIRSRDTEIHLLRDDLDLEELPAEVQGLPRRRDTDEKSVDEDPTAAPGEPVIDLSAAAS